jgi:hypothetical protein
MTIADRRGVGEQHDQAVDANTEAACGRHAAPNEDETKLPPKKIIPAEEAKAGH